MGSTYVVIEELMSLWIDIRGFGARELERGRGYWSSEVEGWGTRDLVGSIGRGAHRPVLELESQEMTTRQDIP
jgi:hypothetical protein